jgi:hypothetical protein
MKMTKTLQRSLRIGALGSATWLFLGAATLPAQDRPPGQNFDPSQMRQAMLDRMRESLEVTDDAEWQALSAQITKVMDARRGVGGFGGPGGPGGPGGAGGPPPRPPTDDNGPSAGGPPPSGGDSDRGTGGPGGPPPGGAFGRETSPEAEALRKSLDAKSPASDLKAKLAQLVEARKKKQAELQKAQDDLRQLLTVRQEAIATSMGLL